MPDNIDALISEVIETEGGYVNHPNDRGGPTKYGITLAALHDWRGTAVTAADVSGMSVDEARQIYRKNYFEGLEFIQDPEIARFVFDYGVNSGPRAARMALQSALKGVGRYDGEIDGIFGPKSRAAYDAAVKANDVALFYALKCERYELLLRFIGRDPSQAVFATGWANRLDKFAEKF